MILTPGKGTAGGSPKASWPVGPEKTQAPHRTPKPGPALEIRSPNYQLLQWQAS